MQRRYTVWQDANGSTRLTYLNGAETLSGVMAELQAASEADVLNWVENDLNLLEPAPEGGVYRSVSDSAVLLYASAAGSIVRVTIPAPRADIFGDDGETVDAMAISPLTTAVVGNVVCPDGALASTYIGGTRVARRAEG